MLCASVRGHTKYKLWLRRVQTYVTTILTPKEAEEYLWNCKASTNGGTEKNIPNDNLLELHVQLVKKSSRNTYLSDKKAALFAHLQMEMKEFLEENAASLKAGKTQTKTDSSNDV